MQLIQGSIAQPSVTLVEVALQVERQKLAKRIWRGVADDGMEFGFELSAPLKHGDCFWQSEESRYVIRQESEPVLEVGLDIAPSAAAGIGWAVGNLHLELCSEPTRLLALDEPAVRQLFARLQVPYRPAITVFRSGRFARGQLSTHELGPSHKH